MGCSNDPSAVEDILDTMHDIIVAADALSGRMHRRLRCADGSGMTFFALRTISAAGRRGISQAELSRQVGMSPAGATRLIDASEKSGIVSRIAHPNDRRLNMIVLTAAGQAMIDEVVAGLETHDARLSPDDGCQHEYLRSQLRALQQSHHAFP